MAHSLRRVYSNTPIARLPDRFRNGDNIDFQSLRALPTLFLEETFGDRPQLARVGTIRSASLVGRDVILEYAFDNGVPPLTNDHLETFAAQLGIGEFEFRRTHWAIKDADLFRVLLRNLQPRRNRPTVFQIAEPEFVEPTLMSAMMPFHPNFAPVYETIQRVAGEFGLRCRRADDIWENPAVMQDVVSLIDRSRIVVCDCSGRNPNVFYEAGIAHTLGREVILIVC